MGVARGAPEPASLVASQAQNRARRAYGSSYAMIQQQAAVPPAGAHLFPRDSPWPQAWATRAFQIVIANAERLAEDIERDVRR